MFWRRIKESGEPLWLQRIRYLILSSPWEDLCWIEPYELWKARCFVILIVAMCLGGEMGHTTLGVIALTTIGMPFKSNHCKSFEIWAPVDSITTLRPRRNGQNFADGIFKRFFFSENIWISIKTSWNFVPNGPINNIPSFVQKMAWRRPGDKPLYEPMIDSLLTYICVTRPQWVSANYCNSFEDWAPVDSIYVCPIFRGVAETAMKDCQNSSHSK